MRFLLVGLLLIKWLTGLTTDRAGVRYRSIAFTQLYPKPAVQVEGKFDESRSAYA